MSLGMLDYALPVFRNFKSVLPGKVDERGLEPVVIEFQTSSTFLETADNQTLVPDNVAKFVN